MTFAAVLWMTSRRVIRKRRWAHVWVFILTLCREGIDGAVYTIGVYREVKGGDIVGDVCTRMINVGIHWNLWIGFWRQCRTDDFIALDEAQMNLKVRYYLGSLRWCFLVLLRWELIPKSYVTLVLSCHGGKARNHDRWSKMVGGWMLKMFWSIISSDRDDDPNRSPLLSPASPIHRWWSNPRFWFDTWFDQPRGNLGTPKPDTVCSPHSSCFCHHWSMMDEGATFFTTYLENPKCKISLCWRLRHRCVFSMPVSRWLVDESAQSPLRCPLLKTP